MRFEEIKTYQNEDVFLYNLSCLLTNAFINWPVEFDTFQEYIDDLKKFLDSDLSLTKRELINQLKKTKSKVALWEMHSIERLMLLYQYFGEREKNLDELIEIALDKMFGKG